jgi:hypothetical protein
MLPSFTPARSPVKNALASLAAERAPRALLPADACSRAC